MSRNNYSTFDKVLIELETVLRSVLGGSVSSREYPGNTADDSLTTKEKQKSSALMRVNHVGEVCAQALYQGQSLAAQNKDISLKLRNAALEEVDHLAWLETRLATLEGRVSYLNPIWYMGAFSLGYFFGLLGDDWSLGFLAETEYQVSEHLNEYMAKLPDNDSSSYAIMHKMREDELSHAEMAEDLGARELPPFVKNMMQQSANCMKIIAYWL